MSEQLPGGAPNIDPANRLDRKTLAAGIIRTGENALSIVPEKTESWLIGDFGRPYQSTLMPGSDSLLLIGPKEADRPIILAITIIRGKTRQYSDPTYTFWSDGRIKKRSESSVRGIQLEDATDKELDDIKRRMDEARRNLQAKIRRTSFDEGLSTESLDTILIEGADAGEGSGQGKKKDSGLPDY